jgi:hypothetical protein
MLARDKRSSLVGFFVSDEEKKTFNGVHLSWLPKAGFILTETRLLRTQIL